MKKLTKLLTVLGLTGFLFSQVSGQETVVVSGTIDADTTWTSNNSYILDGYVFVASGVTLTIEPGTIIQARLDSEITTGDPATALVITNGGMIDAQGTSTAPIIFTSTIAPAGVGGAENTRLWGGLVVLGDAVINSRADGGAIADPVVDQIEGFSLPAEDQGLITYGGTNDAHDAGTIHYISIRHGGFDLGGGNEINGLTMGGVGSGTDIMGVDIYAGKDDGVEMFGGTANLKYVSVAFGRDDSLDFDLGYRGNVQFAFTIGRFFGSESVNAPDEGMDKAGEWDGATSPLNGTPVADYKVYNYTAIGMGSTGSNTGLHIRDNAIVELGNSVLTEFETMLEIDDPFDVDNTSVLPTFNSNIFWSHIPANNTPAGLDAGGSIDSSPVFTNADAQSMGNEIVDPMLVSISRDPDGGLNPLPAMGSPALYGAGPVPSDSFFMQTGYRGAFGSENWLIGWTGLYDNGYLADAGAPVQDNELLNISTRCFVGDSQFADLANASIIIGGTEPIAVVFRARSSSLNLEGATTLTDPAVDLVRVGEGVIGSNDNWADAANYSLIEGNSELDPALIGMDDNECLLVFPALEPGAYSLRGSSAVEGETGLIIVEAFAVRP